MQTIAAIIVVKSKLIWCIVVFLRQKTQCNDHVRSTRIIFEVHCWLWFSNNRIAPLRCCWKFGGEITFILYIETHKLKLSFGGFDRRKKMLVGEKKKTMVSLSLWVLLFQQHPKNILSFLYISLVWWLCKNAHNGRFSCLVLMLTQKWMLFQISSPRFQPFQWYRINAWFLSKFVLWAKLDGVALTALML